MFGMQARKRKREHERVMNHYAFLIRHASFAGFYKATSDYFKGNRACKEQLIPVAWFKAQYLSRREEWLEKNPKQRGE